MQILPTNQKLHYLVMQGSAHLGNFNFWYANGTTYALASNELNRVGQDIGLQNSFSAAQWVSRRYFENKERDGEG